MTEYIEQRLVTTDQEREKMERLCRTVFANEEGRKLLSLLVQARHPMSPRFNLDRPDTHAAAWRDGQADVIQFLWRYGSDFAAPPPPTELKQ